MALLSLAVAVVMLAAPPTDSKVLREAVQEAQKVAADRGNLMKATFRKAPNPIVNRPSTDSDGDPADREFTGYVSMTMGAHTIFLFPFGNGDEVLYWTWGSDANPHRLTYWRRKGDRAVRVCQVKVRDGGDLLPRWVTNGGKGVPKSVPADLKAFLARCRPMAAYCWNAAVGELGSAAITAEGLQVDGEDAEVVDDSKGWLDGGLYVLKAELEFLKKRAAAKAAG